MPFQSSPIVLDYGNPVKGLSQVTYDRWAFAWRVEHPDVPPREALFRQITDTLVPGLFEWHPWTDKVVNGLCNHRWVGETGCSGSCKTFNTTSFACAWWLAAPEESSVILCSTTMKMLRKRAWPMVQNFHSALGGYGNLVDSRTTWQSQQGDDKHAIFAIAVQEGNLNKVADNIKGIHTRRQMVIIDEATSVPAAIWDACTNLYSYPVDAGGEFLLVALANARNRLDQFGRYIEPEEGWDSVTIDTDEWETKPRPEDGHRVHVIRFDFRKSPNVLADRMVSKHLPSKQRVATRLKALKDRGAENDPTHWSNDLGFPPPEGSSKTVFTESLLQKHGAYEKHQFTGISFEIIGAFDQARTGDRPALRFAAMGEISPGVLAIESMPAIILFVDAASKEPIAYQWMALIKKYCDAVMYRGQKYTCPARNFGLDCSNEATFGDLLQKEWNPDIMRLQFGGACSELSCSNEDPRPANTVYRNKRAEMYFRSRDAVASGQKKGMDKDTAAELVTMEYSDTRADGTTKLIVLMDKREYKKKFDISPDLADSDVMLIEVAQRKGFRIIESGFTAEKTEEKNTFVEAAQAVYENITYSAPEPDEDPYAGMYVGSDDD